METAQIQISDFGRSSPRGNQGHLPRGADDKIAFEGIFADKNQVFDIWPRKPQRLYY
jgi:hypothetical protein